MNTEQLATEVELAQEPTDSLAEFRQQVAAEDAAPKKDMSDAALERLRAQNAADKADKVATEKFLTDFKRLPKDTWTVTQLLKRILRADQTAMTVKVEWVGDDAVVTPVPKNPLYSPSVLERMANKILWSLQHGWFPTSVGDVLFLGELTPEEREMSEDKFYRALEVNAPTSPILINGKTPKELASGDSLPLSVFDGREIPLTGLSHDARARVTEIGFDPWLDEVSGVTKPDPQPEVKAAKKQWWTAERCRKQGLCKAGSLCVKAVKGKPAPRAEGKQSCGDICREAYPIRLRNQKARELAN